MPIIADPIVTLPEAKDYLIISSTDEDDKLTSFIAAASQMIYNKVGVISGSPTVEEWHDGGSSRIVLRNQGPIVSVTSVTESYGSMSYVLTQVTLDSGSTSNAYTFTVDLDEGLLVRRASGVAVPFTRGVRNVHVTYVAGYATVPADIKHATLVLLKHLWDTQRGPRSSQSSIPDGSAYSFPNRVLEILSPYIVPGIA